jgi:hypothetical protein
MSDAIAFVSKPASLFGNIISILSNQFLVAMYPAWRFFPLQGSASLSETMPNRRSILPNVAWTPKPQVSTLASPGVGFTGLVAVPTLDSISNILHIEHTDIAWRDFATCRPRAVIEGSRREITIRWGDPMYLGLTGYWLDVYGMDPVTSTIKLVFDLGKLPFSFKELVNAFLSADSAEPNDPATDFEHFIISAVNSSTD